MLLVVYHLHHENWSQVKRRFEREALLCYSSQDVILKRRDVFKYFIKALFGDLGSVKFSRRCTLRV